MSVEARAFFDHVLCRDHAARCTAEQALGERLKASEEMCEKLQGELAAQFEHAARQTKALHDARERDAGRDDAGGADDVGLVAQELPAHGGLVREETGAEALEALGQVALHINV